MESDDHASVCEQAPPVQGSCDSEETAEPPLTGTAAYR